MKKNRYSSLHHDTIDSSDEDVNPHASGARRSSGSSGKSRRALPSQSFANGNANSAPGNLQQPYYLNYNPLAPQQQQLMQSQIPNLQDQMMLIQENTLLKQEVTRQKAMLSSMTEKGNELSTHIKDASRLMRHQQEEHEHREALLNSKIQELERKVDDLYKELDHERELRRQAQASPQRSRQENDVSKVMHALETARLQTAEVTENLARVMKENATLRQETAEANTSQYHISPPPPPPPPIIPQQFQTVIGHQYPTNNWPNSSSSMPYQQQALPPYFNNSINQNPYFSPKTSFPSSSNSVSYPPPAHPSTAYQSAAPDYSHHSFNDFATMINAVANHPNPGAMMPSTRVRYRSNYDSAPVSNLAASLSSLDGVPNLLAGLDTSFGAQNSRWNASKNVSTSHYF